MLVRMLEKSPDLLPVETWAVQPCENQLGSSQAKSRATICSRPTDPGNAPKGFKSAHCLSLPVPCLPPAVPAPSPIPCLPPAHPCLSPACPLPVPCLPPACALPVPCLPLTVPAPCPLPVPCQFPACSQLSLPSLSPACSSPAHPQPVP